MPQELDAIYQRRAVKAFDPVAIPPELREQILDAARFAPSSFNMQPYRFYWIESPERKKAASQLCLSQPPATSATALVAAVADIASLESTSRLQLEWMRSSGFSEEKIREYERTARLGRIIFAPGPFGIFGAFKWALFRALNSFKMIGLPPTSRQEVFKWAIKSTSLACQNLMIAAEALGLNTCPMEGFDTVRLSRFLGLSRKHHEIVMVIAIGKKCAEQADRPQWRRPLATTVTVL